MGREWETRSGIRHRLILIRKRQREPKSKASDGERKREQKEIERRDHNRFLGA